MSEPPGVLRSLHRHQLHSCRFHSWHLPLFHSLYPQYPRDCPPLQLKPLVLSPLVWGFPVLFAFLVAPSPSVSFQSPSASSVLVCCSWLRFLPRPPSELCHDSQRSFFAVGTIPAPALWTWRGRWTSPVLSIWVALGRTGIASACCSLSVEMFCPLHRRTSVC